MATRARCSNGWTCSAGCGSGAQDSDQATSSNAPSAPPSVSTASAMRSSKGSARAVRASAGHVALRPIGAPSPSGAIAISHSEAVAWRPSLGATIV